MQMDGIIEVFIVVAIYYFETVLKNFDMLSTEVVLQKSYSEEFSE